MYLIILLKEDTITPLEPVASDALASIISNSIQNSQYESMVFRGPQENLDLLAQALKQNKTNYTLEQKRDYIQKLAANNSLSLIMHEVRPVKPSEIVATLEDYGYPKVEAVKLVAHIEETESELVVGSYRFGYINASFYDNTAVTAALPSSVAFNPKTGPRLTSYPRGLVDAYINRKIWQYVIKNYKMKIVKQPTLLKQWLMTAIIYQRICSKKRVNPWTEMKTVTHSGTPKDISNKIIESDKLADAKIDVIYSGMEIENYVKSISEQRLREINQVGDKYVVSLQRKIKLQDIVTPSDVLEYLRRVDIFIKSKGKAVLRFQPNIDISFVGDDENPTSLLQITDIKLPTINAQNLVDVSNIEGNSLIILLKKTFKNWFDGKGLRLTKKDKE